MQVTDSWCDLSDMIHSDYVLRDMDFDIVVDLAGWTGNALPSYSHKIAPVQVNYLASLRPRFG